MPHVDTSAGWWLSDRERRQWLEDGYLVRDAVFGAAEVARLQGAVEQAAALARDRSAGGVAYALDGNRFVDLPDRTTVQFEHRPGSDTIRVIEPAHHLAPALDALVDDPRLVQPMIELVGAPAVALWTDKLNLKRPLEGSGFGWHQDSPYWIHDCDHVDRLVNVMVTLDAASEANGCFRVIRGSHRHGRLPGTDDGSQLGGFFTDPACFDLSQQVAMTLPAGSLVWFGAHVVHGSGPNRSTLARRALVLTYQPAGLPMLKTGRVRNAS